jgi:uncharacterized protein YjdB
MIRVTVSASDSSKRQVVWSISDPLLATVNNGLVVATTTGTGGTAIVTATSVDDPKVFATASVKVLAVGAVSLGVN